MNDNFQPTTLDEDFLRTQIELLRTNQLAWRTIEQLGMERNPAFVPPDSKITLLDAEHRKVDLISRFEANLNVELVPRSRILQVSFESADPNLAAAVANNLVNNFIDYSFREKYDATRAASGRMQTRLDELKAKVEQSQQALVDYQREHAIVNINDKQSVVEQRLAELSSQLTAAQSDRIQKEALYGQVRANPAVMAALAQDSLLQKLEEQDATVKQQFVEALSQYGPKFPKVIRLSNQVDEYATLIGKERIRVVQRIGSDFTAASSREKLLREAVEKQKAELGKFNKLLIQQNILQGDFDTNQALYQRLMQHLGDATISAGLKSTNIHLVDSALVQFTPVRPRKLRDTLLGLIGGTFLGILLMVILETLDTSIKNPEELEMLIPLPTLALIPHKRPMVPAGFSAILKNDSQNQSLALELLNNKNSQLAESFRSLRTSILLSMAQAPPQIILVTSSNAGEGKTTTAINLATSLAQQEEEVLIIDCDLRKPQVDKALQLPNKRGLTQVLTGLQSLETSIQKFDSVPRLSVLTSGPACPNPADLLSAEKMIKVLDQCRHQFKYIILDSPPLLLVTDAAILSRLADGTIFVVASGGTSRKAVARAYRTLQLAEGNILGATLNKVDMRIGDYYYGKYSQSNDAYYAQGNEFSS